jgi:hypothetical protein
MHLLERFKRQGLSFGSHVLHLSFNHAAVSRSLGNDANGFQHPDPVCPRVPGAPGKGLKSQGQQGVSGQDGRGLVKLHVACGPAPAQGIIIHCRQIVMDQGIGMNHFNGAAGLENGFTGRAGNRFGRGHAKNRP